MLQVSAILEGKTADLKWVHIKDLEWTQDPTTFCPLAGVGCIFDNHYKFEADCGRGGDFRPAKWWNRGLPKDKIFELSLDDYEGLKDRLGPIGLTWLNKEELKTAIEWAWLWSTKEYREFVALRRTLKKMYQAESTYTTSRVLVGFKDV